MAWDARRLQELRAKYTDTAGETHDPRSPRGAARSCPAGSRPAPYAGMPTLLSAPARAIDWSAPDFSGLDVALLGVPMDLGVTNRSGARFGPRALRSIERSGPYNDALDVAPVYELAVADVGDVPLRSRFRLEDSHVDIEKAVAAIVGAGVVPLSVGGDHSISHPILRAMSLRAMSLRAVGAGGPVGLIHIDAHCDTGGPCDGTRFHHGGPFRNAVLDGVLDPTRTIQIGIRGAAEYLWEFSRDSGMTVIPAREIDTLGIPGVIAQARAVAGTGPTYLSFDIDSLDPAFAPGTGTPEIGGLTSREALALLRGLKGLALVGADVVEVAPQYDATTNTAQVGAQILFEILSLLAFSPAMRR